MGANE